MDAFFVTLEKSGAGQRYIHGSSTKLLFVRQHRNDEYGTSPYLFAEPVHYVQHSRERLIAFVWRLEHALPSDFFNAGTVAAR